MSSFLLLLLIPWREAFKSPTISMDLSINPFNSLRFYIMSLKLFCVSMHIKIVVFFLGGSDGFQNCQV